MGVQPAAHNDSFRTATYAPANERQLRLTDTERDDALKTLTVNQLTDLTLTVGFYQLVCNFLNAFGVRPEEAREL